jgi:hypothetical protein
MLSSGRGGRGLAHDDACCLPAGSLSIMITTRRSWDGLNLGSSHSFNEHRAGKSLSSYLLYFFLSRTRQLTILILESRRTFLHPLTLSHSGHDRLVFPIAIVVTQSHTQNLNAQPKSPISSLFLHSVDYSLGRDTKVTIFPCGMVICCLILFFRCSYYFGRITHPALLQPYTNQAAEHRYCNNGFPTRPNEIQTLLLCTSFISSINKRCNLCYTPRWDILFIDGCK